MSENPELQKAVILRPENQLATSKEAAPSIAAMLQAVVEKGISGENVHALEKLVDLYEKMDNRDARHAFAEAFNALQSEMPRIQVTEAVPDRDGNLKYKFAPFEKIMEQVQPLLLKHGFSVSFSTKFEHERLVKTCTLSHKRGHSQSNDFAVRIGKGPPGSSESQADGAASSYAKRFAFCDALNIVTEKDTDGADPRIDGAPITAAQAKSLRDRVAACGADAQKFLAFAGASTFEEIPSAKLAMLESNLKRKEAKP